MVEKRNRHGNAIDKYHLSVAAAKEAQAEKPVMEEAAKLESSSKVRLPLASQTGACL
jgi:hypothetical protein